MIQSNVFRLPSIRIEISGFKISQYGFHGEEVSAQSHRRACVGVSAFFCGECGVH